MKPPTLADFDVVLTGAGISVPQPTNLPSGDTLTVMVWRWLYDSVGGPAGLGLRAEARMRATESGMEAGLRLEQLMEVAQRFVPLEQLVEVYRVMGSAVPGFAHVALAASGLPVVTVNMDRLLTDAGVENVSHLHGRFDKPDTIKTTISQYSNGLSDEAQEMLRRGIEGKRLLVMGYSGRDRDVLPLIAHKYRPSAVTWIRFRFDPPFPEVELAREAWEAHGILYTEIVGSGQEFLHNSLGVAPDEALFALSLLPLATSEQIPRHLVERLRRDVPEESRRLACASILFELALYDDARSMASGTFIDSGYRLAARKLVARALRRAGRSDESARVLIRAVLEFGPAPVITEMSAVLAHTWAWPAGRVIDWTLVSAARVVRNDQVQRAARLAQSRRRQRALNSGDVRAALAHMGTRESVDLDRQSRVDESTWIADALKLSGDFDAALDLVDKALEDAPYSDLSQRAYLMSKRLEIRSAAGRTDVTDPHGADMRSLREAEVFSEYAASAGSERLWLESVRACCHASEPGRSRAILDSARAWWGKGAGAVDQFYLIQSAEQARFDGDGELCRSELALLERTLRHRLVGWGTSWRLAATMIRLELDLDEHPPNRRIVGQLHRLGRRYESRKMPAAAAWARITLARAKGEPVSDQERETMSSRGWLAHAARAVDPARRARWDPSV